MEIQDTLAFQLQTRIQTKYQKINFQTLISIIYPWLFQACLKPIDESICSPDLTSWKADSIRAITKTYRTHQLQPCPRNLEILQTQFYSSPCSQTVSPLYNILSLILDNYPTIEPSRFHLPFTIFFRAVSFHESNARAENRIRYFALGN